MTIYHIIYIDGRAVNCGHVLISIMSFTMENSDLQVLSVNVILIICILLSYDLFKWMLVTILMLQVDWGCTDSRQQCADSSTMTSANASCGPAGYQKLFTMPVLGMFLAGALLGILLLPYLKSKWLSYLSSYCGCVSLDKMPSCHHTRPRIMPPGMQHGNMVDWVNCPADHHHKVLLHHHAWDRGIPERTVEVLPSSQMLLLQFLSDFEELLHDTDRSWCSWSSSS